MVRNFTRIIIKNNIRIYLSDLTDVVNQILNYHKYKSLPSLILANAIATFSPLKLLYESNNLLIRIKTNGAIKSLILETKFNNIRALISNSNIETEYDKKGFNTIPLILGIGDNGSLEISREVKGEYFKSETPLAKADIVTDLAYFLNKSDQIYSAVLTDVFLNENNHHEATRAKNVIFQLLPNHIEEDKIWIEEFIKNHKFSNYSVLDYEKEIDGKLLDIKQLDGSCWCSKEKIISAIKLLKKNEINDLFKDKKEVEVICEFCETKHKISKEDVNE